MIFNLYITSNQSAAQHAFEFAQATFAENHRIQTVFLQDRGVLLSNSENSQAWSQLANKKQFEIILCSNAANEHGIEESHLHTGFRIDSLMNLLEAERDCDRLVSFRD